MARVMIKATVLFVLIFQPLYAMAGGDYFDIEVIGLEKINNEEYHFSFIPLSAPYGMDVGQFTGGLNKMTVVIKFGCNQSYFTCLFTKRSFSKNNHLEAIRKLRQEALPGKKIKFGVMSVGFEALPNRKGFYRSNGLCVIDNIIYSYYNSHL